MTDKETNKQDVKNYKDMYCSVATVFQPSYASISSQTSYEGPVQRARKLCNSLTITTMIDESPENVKRRNKACQQYNSMK